MGRDEKAADRIAHLQTLQDGWLDGHGKAVTAEVADKARAMLACAPNVAAACSIFPTESGGLEIEFVRHAYDWSVTVLFDGAVEFSAVRIAPANPDAFAEAWFAAMDKLEWET